MGVGVITHVTPRVPLETRGGHVERISFYLLPSLSHPVTLGLSWLRAHNPHLHWSDNRVLEWAAPCKTRCLSHRTLPLQSTSVENPEAGEGLRAPPEYRFLEEVFSPVKATQRPPHQKWDCTITLKSDTVPARCRVYPLFQEEDQIMAQYIKKALQQEYICPSTSPSSTSVFFVKKKDGGLRPCVDYKELNRLLVKYPYPLPVVTAALEQLRGSQWFTKLDLRSAYNLIRIREGNEGKTAFSTSSGHYEYLVLPYGLATAPSVFQVLQEFLGRSVVAYIDDILIYSPSWDQHVHDVRGVLGTLLQNHLYCKLEKCEFHHREVNFM
ncbi:hypothetical protein P4O66_004076 [Electrophorus voltai]|uniref:ribonuclease H n=1 Tax=Electrophorus voltai TaxID=2609070 RepID=A0AAD8ZQX3_9TELE|nr:hypothetical protein P4O66_004076 [Electrophorus voltai]